MILKYDQKNELGSISSKVKNSWFIIVTWIQIKIIEFINSNVKTRLLGTLISKERIIKVNGYS